MLPFAPSPLLLDRDMDVMGRMAVNLWADALILIAHTFSFLFGYVACAHIFRIK